MALCLDCSNQVMKDQMRLKGAILTVTTLIIFLLGVFLFSKHFVQ